jgi:hypothetical protein
MSEDMVDLLTLIKAAAFLGEQDFSVVYHLRKPGLTAQEDRRAGNGEGRLRRAWALVLGSRGLTAFHIGHYR